MISDKLSQALNKQIESEFTASQQYLAIAVYFAQQGLDGWASFFYRQSDEEREHGLKIVRFLVEVESDVSFPAISAVKPSFSSALEAVTKALAWEKEVTRQFHRMAESALEEKDYTGFQFLQWFITEQVEEVSTMQKLVDLMNSGINLFQAEPLLSSPH